jgi:hypothetical protein
MRINAQNGNVGIGTTTPTAQLNLGTAGGGYAGPNGGDQLFLGGTANAGANLGGKKLHIYGYDNDGTVTYPIYAQDENGYADFWIRNRPNQTTGLPTMHFAGNVGIGTTSPTHLLTVNGTIKAEEVIVEAGIAAKEITIRPQTWADDVFAPDYALPSLTEVAAHIGAKQHLPGVPSAATVAEQGVPVGEMQQTLLRKIEEMTLYMIQQDRRIAELERKLTEASAAEPETTVSR